MGVSTYCLLWGLWIAKTKQASRGIIYWLPTDSAVGDFVNTKVDPFIQENEELFDAKGNVAGKTTSNQGLKFMYDVPIFFRGLQSKNKVKSISADAAIYDEFDEADAGQVAQARKRLSASAVKLTRDLSTPTLPDYGINKRFQESDQCYYGFTCGSCSKINILEHNFPRGFKQNKEGKYFHACVHCESKLDITKGKWYSMEPKNELRGYHISQLYSPFVSPDEIMHEYQTTEFIGYFHNHVLGVPYLSSTDRISKEQVLALCDPARHFPIGCKQPTAMGVDVGSTLHCTILDHVGVVQVFQVRHFEELSNYILRYNVRELVIDALPETRKVRELIEKHKWKAWACYYNDNQKGEYNWNDEQRIVSVNRTESLDAGTLSILESRFCLPQRNTEIELFAQHCENTAKASEENKDKGEKKYVYKKLGPDHYRHSLNYAMIALSRMRHGSIASVFR